MNKEIEIANKIAEEIKSLPFVLNACVDDFNKHGSFQIVVSYDFKKLGRNFKPKDRQFSLAKVGAGIRKALNSNKAVSSFGKSIEQPTRQYDRSYGQCSFEGYDKDYTMVDFVVVL